MGRRKKTVRVELLPVGIADRLAYIDTLRLRQFAPMSRQVFKALLTSVKRNPTERKRRIVREKVVSDTGACIWFLKIHQPSFYTLDILEAFRDEVIALHGGIAFEIVEINISLDLLVRNRNEAERLGRFVVARMIKNGRPQEPWLYDPERKRPQRTVRARTHLSRDPEDGYRTAYLSYNLHRGIRVAVYADRTTKAAIGSPCVHIEWRILGADALRKNSLCDLENLRTLDYRAFWDGQLRMVKAPAVERLASAVGKARKMRSASSIERTQVDVVRIASTLIRAGRDEDGDTNAHDLLLRLQVGETSGKRPIRLFTPQPHEWMLPARENALWDDLWAEVWESAR